MEGSDFPHKTGAVGKIGGENLEKIWKKGGLGNIGEYSPLPTMLCVCEITHILDSFLC